MLAALLLAALLNPWEMPAPKSFADCDARVAQYPRELEAWFCYQQLSFLQPKAEWEKKTGDHLRQRIALHPDEPYARLMLGLVDPRDTVGEELYPRAADELHAQHLHSGEVAARTAYATGLCENGQFTEADEQLAKATAAAEASGEPDLISQADVYAANCARAQADYGRSFALYRAAYDRLTANPKTWRTKWLLGNSLDGLGQLYAKTGRHQEALELFLAQLEKRDSFMRSCAEHRVAQEAVRLARQGGMSWDEADAYLKTALDDEVKYGCRVYINGGEIYTRLLLAERLGATDEGIAEARHALQETRDEADPIRVCGALRLLATLLIEHDHESRKAALEAAALLDEALAVANKYRSRGDIAEGLMTRALLHARLGEPQQALADAQAALEQFDRIREMQPDEMVRARAATEWSSAYHYVSGLLLEEGAVEPALETMERMRARSLLELLESGSIRSQANAGANDEPLRRERSEVLAKLSKVQRTLLEPALGEAERSSALEEAQRLETKEESLRDRIARAAAPSKALLSPATPSAAKTSAPSTLAEVQAQLDEGEAMLLFQLADRDGRDGAGSAFLQGSSWVLAVSKRQVRALRLTDTERLAGEVDLLSGLIARRDGSEESGAAALYKSLLGEALPALGPGIARLIIVPDGALHRLPFEALRDPKGHALAESVEISLAPSAALWLLWRREPRKVATIPALALGDPLLAANDISSAAPRATGAASPSALPGSSAPPGSSALPNSSALSDHRADLWTAPAPLPGARDEALAVVSALGRGSQSRLGSDASEHFLKTADLSPYGLLHFAAHARIDESRPERSAILLTPGSPDEDGLLQLREIGNLNLRGSAVVLATCSSSSGELIQGEGVMSLARGFFQAGARAVIGSLWPLRDDEAKAFFAPFYERLGEGATLSDALATARRERIRAGAPAAAWAGMVLLGDGSSAPIAQLPRGSAGPHFEWTIFAILGAAALGAVLLRRARRRL